MNKKIIAFLFLCSPLLAVAQKNSQRKDKNAVKMASTITTDDLKKHLNIIASPEMEGRNTPSPGLEKAANYIEEHFKSLGLLPGNNGSYRQLFPLYKDSVMNAEFKINGDAQEMNKDFQPLSLNYAAEMRFSQVVFAGYGISDDDKWDDYKNLDVAGKLVMILDGSPSDYKPSQSGFRSPSSTFGKLNAALKNGAAGLLIVYNNFPRREQMGAGNWTRSNYKATQYPFTFTISPAMAKKIMGEDGGNIFEKMKAGALESKIYHADIDLTYSKQLETTHASNVLGVLEGTDLKDEYVFITAHYDHLGKRGDVIYYGADDDGSGTCAVLEMAEAFVKAKQAGKGPRRSIVFMTVSGEEKGLWGSEYYTNHPVFPLDKTTVDLNIDMIGRSDSSRKIGDSTNYVYVVGDDKLSTDLKKISEDVNKRYVKMELDYKFNDPNDRNRIYFRSDHYNFAQKGVPIIFYYDGMLGADYHKPTDTPDKINYELYKKRTQLVFYTAWEMANRNEMLKRDLKLEIPKGF